MPIDLEFAIGVLNGAVGDYLARTGNGLATDLTLTCGGKPIGADAASLARAYPAATGKVVVLVHGLMNTEAVWAMPDGTDYGSRLAEDLGYTPLYVRYNTGRAIPENGAALTTLLADVVRAWPVPVTDIVPLGYSMGGLVVRSACHLARVAGSPWLNHVSRAIYVGTPHRGAPLERLGRVTTRVLATIPDPTTRLVGEIADLRSRGVKDLGDAHPVPLLAGIRHYLVAGALPEGARLALWFGDAMVPVASATDGGCVDPASVGLPPDHIRLVRGLSHVAIAHHPDVYTHVRAWCADEGPCPT